jgi:hypothetical protein
MGCPLPPPLAALDLGGQGHPDAAPQTSAPTNAGPSSGPSNWPEGVGCHLSHQRRLPWAPRAGGGCRSLGPGHRHPPRPSSTAAERSPAGSGSIPRSGSASAPAPVPITTRWSGSGGAEDVLGRHPGGDDGRSGASGAGLLWGAATSKSCDASRCSARSGYPRVPRRASGRPLSWQSIHRPR